MEEIASLARRVLAGDWTARDPLSAALSRAGGPGQGAIRGRIGVCARRVVRALHAISSAVGLRIIRPWRCAPGQRSRPAAVCNGRLEEQLDTGSAPQATGRARATGRTARRVRYDSEGGWLIG